MLSNSRDQKWAGIFGNSETIQDYIKEHSKNDVWGYSKELILAAKLYYVNFVLYKPEEKPTYTIFSADYVSVCFIRNRLQILWYCGN